MCSSTAIRPTLPRARFHSFGRSHFPSARIDVHRGGGQRGAAGANAAKAMVATITRASSAASNIAFSFLEAGRTKPRAWRSLLR
jgi:hypothetical protein